MEKITRAMFDQYMTPNYAPAPMVLSHGSGSRVWDTDGRDYIDFVGGIAVNALGHAAPELVEALTVQAKKLWHVSNAFATDASIGFARTLIEATFADRAFFSNSGSEANEAALKLARKFAFDHYGAEKSEIISFDDSFHGRTLFTVTVGGKPGYSEGFGPLPDGVTHLPFNDIDALGDAFSDNVCAVMVEPIQGESGVIAADPAFLQRARALCDAHDALLIFDEVQSGMGRTGELFAYMSSGVVPDILTTAKALGGGIPISAMLTTDDIASSLVVGTHGSTYGGNPLVTAVAQVVFDIVNTPEFLGEVKRKAKLLFSLLDEVNSELSVFSDIRGKGLWVGCQVANGEAKPLVEAGLAAGVMTLKTGVNVVRMAPALNISDDEIREGVARLRAGLASLPR